MKRIIFAFGLMTALLVGCDKGQKLGNMPPDTRISISEINLTGEDRLRSQVTLNWLGFDKDGYITGYELSFDGSTWKRTISTDSTFEFSLDAGQDTTDITFFVRAIDNEDERDPDPAFLEIPIKNTPPTAVFDSVNVIPDTAFIVTTSFLDVFDLDGIDNIDSVFLKVNNGDWYGLPRTVTTVTLLPSNPVGSGTLSSDVFIGSNNSPQSVRIGGLNLNGDNVMYLRARDIAGSESAIDTSKTFFVRNQTSDLLVIDANGATASPTPEDVILPALASAYPAGFDRIDMRRAGGVNKPTLWSPTFSLMIELYDKVFWYSDESLEGFGILEEAAGAVQGYLNANGKMLITTGFPSTYDNTSVVQEFTPVDSISTANGLARIPTNNAIWPAPDFQAVGYDTLRASEFIGRSTPIYVKSAADSMYTAQIVASGGWVGPTSLCARSTNANNQTNVVFLSEQLHRLNGNPAGLEKFLMQVLNNEFNW